MARVSREEWEKNIDALLEELRPELRCAPQRGLERQEKDLTRLFCCAGPYCAGALAL